MSPEVALLHTVWELFKGYVPAKDKVDIADQLLKNFEEHVDIEDINVYKNEFDKPMKAAILELFPDEDADDDDDEW